MKRFVCTNCALLNDGLFMIGSLGGLPAIMNLDNGRIKYYGWMDGFVAENKSVVIDYLEIYQNKMYALDSYGNSLIIFDLESSHYKYVALNCHQYDLINFAAFERCGLDYYIFPKYGDKILVFDLEKNTITEIAGYLEDNNEIQCVCRVNNDLWILPQNADIICCFNLNTKKNQKFKLNRTIKDCVHAVYKEGSIYILNMFGIIYIWDIEKKDLKEIMAAETEHDDRYTMSRIIYAGNSLILLPARGSDIKIYDLQKEKVSIYHEYPEDYFDETTWYRFYGYCDDEEYYYFAMCAGSYLLRIDKQTGRLIWTKPLIKNLGEIAVKLLLGRNNSFFKESFLEVTDLPKVSAVCGNQCNKMNIDIGRKIYTKICTTEDKRGLK